MLQLLLEIGKFDSRFVLV